jgi:hypothetical protein
MGRGLPGALLLLLPRSVLVLAGVVLLLLFTVA